MVIRKHAADWIRDEQGAVAVPMALTLVALTSLAALAIDLSRQTTAGLELDHLTEIACMRMAAAVQDDPSDSARRRAAAEIFAGQRSRKDDKDDIPRCHTSVTAEPRLDGVLRASGPAPASTLPSSWSCCS